MDRPMPEGWGEQPRETTMQRIVRENSTPLADVPRTTALPPVEPPAVRVPRPGRTESEPDSGMSDEVRAQGEALRPKRPTTEVEKLAYELQGLRGFVASQGERLDQLTGESASKLHVEALERRLTDLVQQGNTNQRQVADSLVALEQRVTTVESAPSAGNGGSVFESISRDLWKQIKSPSLWAFVGGLAAAVYTAGSTNVDGRITLGSVVVAVLGYIVNRTLVHRSEVQAAAQVETARIAAAVYVPKGHIE